MDNQQFRGIIPPMVTPLKEWDTLDQDGMVRLIDHILSGGVHGLFLLGTTGEAPSLSHRLRKEIVQRALDQIKERIPVLVGITDTSFDESINLAEYAAEKGASAVVLAPPYYFPAGQLELLEYLEHLVPRLPLPLFLYNMPTHTKLFFEPETVKAASEIPGVIGLKDSSANMVYFHQLQQIFKDHNDFRLFIGPEELLGETLVLGGHGGVCGGGNLIPELYVELYEKSIEGDFKKMGILHERIMQISTTIYSVGKYKSSYLKGLKCSLALMGICDDFMAEPFHRFRVSERNVIRQYLIDLGLSPVN
ncbi:MAG: dihydrodipicolinate synthase family protein [Candidatus Neomarinimicrobiota bacterium]|jgi:4-hydroxy-tetrahydrodipicolinate synthase|nr:dihydrodipicolinate synthase family protein [Candidatus Neomarinimicrobiota bacterium]MEC7730175.1 dihydrodipicolinate synthase family protein [Candidatus Neomarinimicrobiota bacterium]HJM33070.1 dihydrodipicolinate synthase family protein [Candidatus Neomarinimicrobiota bacterium]